MALAYGQETAQAIIDQIRMNPETHNQGMWESGCRTTRCVAGWAQWFHEARVQQDYDTNDYVPRFARRALGLSAEDAAKLFWATNEEQALRALEYIAKGDAIDWDAVFPYGIPSWAMVTISFTLFTDVFKDID